MLLEGEMLSFEAGSYTICFVSHFLVVTFLLLVTEGAIAGATAGVVVETALYPIDTIKTRLQVDYDTPCSWNLDCRKVND